MIEVKRDDFFVESIKNPIEYGTYYKINPKQRSAGGEHLHQSHPRPPGAGGAEKGGNGGDPGGLGRRLPPDGRPRNPFSPAGGGGGEYPLCGLRVAQRGHRP